MEQQKNEQEYLTMWSVQADVVLKTLDNQGIYYVKKAYIKEKYQDVAWVFENAYKFFVEEASKRMEREPEAESPVWMFRDKMWAVPTQGSTLLKLKIPKEEVLLFDLRIWSKILNLSYVGEECEEEAFDKELQKIGINDAMEIFQKPYYALQKNKVVNSWKKLFERGLPEEQYQQGAAWSLKKEWIEERYFV